MRVRILVKSQPASHLYVPPDGNEKHIYIADPFQRLLRIIWLSCIIALGQKLNHTQYTALHYGTLFATHAVIIILENEV